MQLLETNGVIAAFIIEIVLILLIVVVSYLHVKVDEQDNKCNHVAGLKEQAAQRKTTGENHCT